MYFTWWDCNKNTCTTFRSKGSVKHLWTSILDLSHHQRRPHPSLYRLPFLRCPFLNSSIPCCPIPHPAVPRSAKAQITLPTLSDTVALVSTSFEDALTSNNHSATMLMNETLHWSSSSSSSSNILNRQPSVSVDLHYSLDNAKLNPSELESQAETEGFGVCFFEVHVLKIRFSWSDSGICLTIKVCRLLSSLEGSQENLRTYW